MTRVTTIALAALLVVPWGQAHAQVSRTPIRTLIIESTPEPPLSQYPVPALAPELDHRLQQAIRLREAGAIDKAEPILRGVAKEVPDHPLVVRELARLYLARGEDAAVIQLGRGARLAHHDSVLVSRELATAYERLGRAREAAAVALEHWSVAPTQADWAMATVERLLAVDPRGVRDAMRRTAARLPERVDIARGLGRVEWRVGDADDVLRAVDPLDGPGVRPQLRWILAEDMLRTGTPKDTAMAITLLLDLAADPRHDVAVRTSTSRAVWQVIQATGDAGEGAQRLARALKDVPASHWISEVLVGVARALRESGRTSEARRLLGDRGLDGAGAPQIALERALADLRDGPAERALPGLRAVAESSPEAGFRHAEALFFAGQVDSAKAWYERVAKDPSGPFTGAALERVFLIEETRPPEALRVFGQIAYLEWRGDVHEAVTLADSLYETLPHGPTWAQAGLTSSGLHERAGDDEAALAPLLAVAESEPGDRLAPLARERAGDLYAQRLGDDALAVQQYEECLARYPRSWNAPEVRRKLEALRRDRRF